MTAQLSIFGEPEALKAQGQALADASQPLAWKNTEPTYADLRARLLLAQALISHRLDISQPDVQDILAALRGDLTLSEAK